MAWKIEIFPPNNRGVIKQTYTDTSPGTIADGFRWKVRGAGDCIELRFQARPFGLNLGPRDMVKLYVGETTPTLVLVFFGVVTQLWPSDDVRLREYVVSGGRYLLERRIYEMLGGTQSMDVGALANLALANVGPQLEAWTAQNTGYQIAVNAGTITTLADHLDGLVKALATPGIEWAWGVDVEGKVFFRQSVGQLFINYLVHKINWREINAGEIVTKSTMVIYTGQPSPPCYLFGYIANYQVSSLVVEEGPKALTVSQTDIVNDPLYRSEKIELYDGEGMIGAIIIPTNQVVNNVVNGNNIADGSLATIASFPQVFVAGGTGIAASWQGRVNQTIYGCKITYKLKPGHKARLLLERRRTNGVGGPDLDGSAAFWELPAQQEFTEQVFIAPLCHRQPDPSGAGDTYTQIEVHLDNTTGPLPGTFEVADIKWLVINTYPVQNAAYSRLQKPFLVPAEVRFEYYKVPDPYGVFSGSPVGSVTGKFVEWEYAWTQNEKYSIGRLETDGAGEAAKSVRIDAERLDGILERKLGMRG